MKKMFCAMIIGCTLFCTNGFAQSPYDFVNFHNTNSPVITGTNFKAVAGDTTEAWVLALTNFGINSTLILGNGISLTASDKPNGYGEASFSPQIGKLVLNAGTAGGNRQLTITKPLYVKGSFEIRTGSNVTIKAQTTVTQ